MAAKTDFVIPLAAIGVGVSIAMPRLLKPGSPDTTDWIYITVGFGIVAGVVVAIVAALRRRR